MGYETRRATEPRFIVRFYADDDDDPESGGEWRVIDAYAEVGQNIMAVFGTAANTEPDPQYTAAVLHARSLNG